MTDKSHTVTRASVARSLLAALALFVWGDARAEDVQASRAIVVIGGPNSHRPGEHDYHAGVALLRDLLLHSPDLQRYPQFVVRAYPDGWPPEEAFEGAATIVLYFDGADQHPLLDPARRRHFQSLVDQGVGVVALHQAFTVPSGNRDTPMRAWVGASRNGLRDRTMETIQFDLRSPRHPVARGVQEAIYFDEFYPTLEFAESGGRVTPIISAEMRAQIVEGRPARSRQRRDVVAWTFERDGGGRSFGFSGAHFVNALRAPPVRTMILNSIFWTAHLEVPAGGVRTTEVEQERRSAPQHAVVSTAAQDIVVEQPWGEIRWYASGSLGNSGSLTSGLVTIREGQQNPRHFHPNCDEVLHVLGGRIRHTMNDESVELGPGDTVTIPQGVRHNAVNIGSGNALIAVSFSSAWREVVGE